jgi:RecA/RadA recombinase
MLLDIIKSKTDSLLTDSLSLKNILAPTGFTIIDILGCTLEFDVNHLNYVNGGLDNKFYISTGESATGKTTLTLQCLAGCVDWWNKNYPNSPGSDLIMFDSEDNTEISRVIQVTKWDINYIHKHFQLLKEVDLLKIYNLILQIADAKKKNLTDYTVETTVLDLDGSRIKTIIPTYILIDSAAAIQSNFSLDTVERDKTGDIKKQESIVGNIDAMRAAKEMTSFVKKVKPLLTQFGINLTIINHIVQSPQMSMYEAPKRALPMLKPGERLLLGYESIYQAYGISRLDAKEKLNEKNPIFGDDIYGIITQFSYVKNKNGPEGLAQFMIFNSETGYEPLLSDFHYLYMKNYGINGSPIKQYMKILPEIQFTRKTLLEKAKEHPILARAIQFTAKTKMIYDIVLGSEAPSLDLLEKLPYHDRVALILSFSNTYQGYSDVLSQEILNLYQKGVKNLFNSDYTLKESFFSNYEYEQITEDIDNLSFLINYDYITPHSDPNEYFIDKDTELKDEFWFKIPKCSV